MDVNAMQYLEVRISEQEQKRITLATLNKAFGWYEDYTITDGKVVLVEEVYGSHRSDTRKYVRVATEMDKALYQINQTLKVRQ